MKIRVRYAYLVMRGRVGKLSGIFLLGRGYIFYWSCCMETTYHHRSKQYNNIYSALLQRIEHCYFCHYHYYRYHRSESILLQ